MMDDAFTITIITSREKALAFGMKLKGTDMENFQINELPGKKICPVCGGTGNKLKSMYQKCEPCGGTGVVNK